MNIPLAADVDDLSGIYGPRECNIQQALFGYLRLEVFQRTGAKVGLQATEDEKVFF